MKKQTTRSEPSDQPLRDQDPSQKKNNPFHNLSRGDLQRLLDEQRVRQGELETRHRELGQAMEELKKVLGQYREIYDLRLAEKDLIPVIDLMDKDRAGMGSSRLFRRAFLRCLLCGSSYYKLKETAEGIEYLYECGLKLRIMGGCSGNAVAVPVAPDPSE